MIGNLAQGAAWYPNYMNYFGIIFSVAVWLLLYIAGRDSQW